MGSSTLYGYLAVAGACAAFGSFGVPCKTESVVAARVHPVVFQLYYSLAIFVTSWGVLAYNPFVFTWYGIAGAALWTPASILSLMAINAVGLSVAQAVWSGTTILVSFLWGALVFGDHVGSVLGSVCALCTLALGLAGLATIHAARAKTLHRALGFRVEPDVPAGSDTSPLVGVNHGGERGQSSDDAIAAASAGSFALRVRGILCAVGLGLLNGSLMVPLRQAPKNAAGINYIISFSIGVLVITPLLTGVYAVATQTRLALQPSVALIPGIAAGTMWQIGNFCSIYATLYLGLTVGYPLTQLALLVAGLWGWLYYGELEEPRHIAHFWISAVVVLGGAAVLAIAG